MKKLLEKIKCKKAKVAVIGMGYVGLPLVVEFCKKGFFVYGIDMNKKKVRALSSGISYVKDVPSKDIKLILKKKKFIPTDNFDVINDSDCVIICVPTPLRKSKDPDISYILSAIGEIVKRNYYQGKLIILESTTYPGTTVEILQTRLEHGKYRVGKDFYLAFSPERVDPGNAIYLIKNTPKIVGGVTAGCQKVAYALYSAIIDKVKPVSSPTVAETVKLLENVFRSVNIGLINEIAMLCHRMNIDVWEVIEGASTKPFGFMTFYPGPGLGGHCIPLDPFYLSWKARSYDFNARFIELAGEINSNMPYYVINRVSDCLNSIKKSFKNSKVLVVGVSYKKDIEDMRESPAIDIIKLLLNKGARVTYYDPYISEMNIRGKKFKSIKFVPKNISSADISVIITDHSNIDYKKLVKYSKLIFDTRNALKKFKGKKIVRL